MEIILLRITGYGWGMIVLVLVSVLVALKILKRKNRDGRPGCLGTGYVSLIVFCLLSLSAMLAGVLGSFLVNALTLPRYQARVVDYNAFESTRQQEQACNDVPAGGPLYHQARCAGYGNDRCILFG